MAVVRVTYQKWSKEVPCYAVECKSVNLYWDRLMCTHVLTSFDTSSLHAIYTSFHIGDFRVGGKRVTTSYTCLGSRFAMLELLELSADVTEEDIRVQIPQELLVGTNWSTQQRLNWDSTKQLALLRTMCSRLFGTVDGHSLKTLPTVMRVTAWFKDDEHAKKAIAVFNDSKMPPFFPRKVTARLGYELKFKGPEEWVQKVKSNFQVGANVPRNIRHLKFASLLDDGPGFILSEENRQVLVEALRWIGAVTFSTQTQDKNKEPRPLAITKPTDEPCTICLDPPKVPVITQCKHVYCVDCFESLCVSIFSHGSSKYRIACPARKPSDASTAPGPSHSICGCTPTLPELQTLLKPHIFERLLGVSFRSYVHRNPHKLRECPTANCTWTYFVTAPYNQPDQQDSEGLDLPDIALHITCLDCLADICMRCQIGHSDKKMTCAEFQAQQQDARATAAYIEEHGIKKCPTCTTLLDKVEGCDHVVCPACNAHLCWKCLQLFTGERAADLVYIHLAQVHGGFLIEYDEDGRDYDEDEDDRDDRDHQNDENDADDEGNGGDHDDHGAIGAADAVGGAAGAVGDAAGDGAAGDQVV